MRVTNLTLESGKGISQCRIYGLCALFDSLKG